MSAHQPSRPPPVEPHLAGFERSCRFELHAELGRGATGVVYDVTDAEHGHRVAMKLSYHPGSRFEQQMRRELEVSQAVDHEGLVTVHHFGTLEGYPFYTMECVRGPNLLEYVRPDRSLPSDESRLRAILPQLVRALAAMHAAYRVHRDVKPSNVRVTEQGRAVLLDLGIAAELGALQAVEAGIGTPAYMAPEQVAGERVGPPADLYALGVVLYEALTGRLPHPEAAFGHTIAKIRHAPPDPQALNPYAPRDLAALCMDLLAPRPQDRPVPAQVLCRLGVPANDVGLRPPLRAPAQLSGRQRELDELHQAVAQRVRTGGWVHVAGPPGRGKTRLVEALLTQLDQVQVLQVCCEPHPWTSHGGLDGLVEALVQHATRQQPQDVVSMGADDGAWLRQMFPAFQRLPRRGATRAEASVPDPVERRFRALRALRRFVVALCERTPMVLWIDEAQHLPADALSVLQELWRPPTAPGAVLVTAGGDAPLARLAPGAGHTLQLEPLQEDDARSLVSRFWRDARGEAPPDAAGLVAHSDGEPWLVLERVRLALTSGTPLPVGPADCLARRLSGLSAGALHTLQVLVTAHTHQVDYEDLAQVTGLEPQPLSIELEQLCEAAMVRRVDEATHCTLLVEHEPLRQAVVDSMDAERRASLHAQWAVVRCRRSDEDTYARFIHLREAGDVAGAAEQARAAAQRARASLAFERAAALLSDATALSPEANGDAARSQLRELGAALAHAGQNAAAARVYAQAAKTGSAAERIELERIRAALLFRAGHISEGTLAGQQVLASVGLHLPTSPERALPSLAWHKLLLWLRGTRYRPRATREMSPLDLSRSDALWAMLNVIGWTDPVRGMELQVRAMRFALRAGEPYRVARGLLRDSVSQVAVEPPPLVKTRRMLADARAACGDRSDAYLEAYFQLSQGMVHFFSFEFEQARGHLRSSDQLFRDECEDFGWETTVARQFICGTLDMDRRWGELDAEVGRFLLEADRRGDHFARAVLTPLGRVMATTFAHDDPARALEELKLAMEPWPRDRLYMQHFFEFLALGRIHGYQRSPDMLERMIEAIEPLRKTIVGRGPVIQAYFDVFMAQGMFEKAVNSGGSERSDYLRRLEKLLRRLSRTQNPMDHMAVAGMRPRIALLQGDLDAARARLLDAIEVSRQVNRDPAIQQYLLGKLEGGQDGAERARQAHARIATWGAANVEHVIRLEGGAELPE